MLRCTAISTRVTDLSNTIIDHFITKIISLQMFQIDIADHYPVFCIITCDSIPSSQSKKNIIEITKRLIWLLTRRCSFRYLQDML